MTPDAVLNPTEDPKIQPPSTAGMTTRVVKGSLWTLAGQIAPFAVSFASTPFIIRFLGAESYGVLLLVGLIPMYFSFADFGMGIASTKFASEAYGEGDARKESQILWTATTIAAICSLVVAVPMFLFSGPIVAALNVPEHLLGQASIALKITSAAFVLTILAAVINSPMLARLRMDLNTVTQAGTKILLAVGTPLVLYFGFGIIGAAGWALIVAILTVAAVIWFSSRLLPSLFQGELNREYVRPLLKFGGGWVVGMMAVVLLVNLDKLLLTRMVSVTSLAHYSVAFTFANTATLFGSAMVQSMVPAFSQLTAPEKKSEFDGLFARAVRLNLIWIFPAVAFLFVIAKPFFTIWAGPEFGAESTLPFYVLLIGLIFTIPAYVPFAAIAARGRTDASAKLYWLELFLYAIALFFLIKYFGIMGAAIAWSLRAFIDTLGLTLIARRLSKVGFQTNQRWPMLLLSVATLVPPIAISLIYGDANYAPLALTPICILIYSVLIWRKFVQPGERDWIEARVRELLRKLGYQSQAIK